MRRWVVALAVFGALRAGDALAYRPFDGTDAAVAEPGQIEIELGPAQYQQVGPNQTLFAPDVIFNYGLADRWELVLQGGLARGLQPDSSGVALLGNGLFLKGVLREGSLQDKSGPSIATEFGFLLPDISAESPSGMGGTAAVIVSQRWPALTAHFNASVALTRQQQADLAFSVIVEGPNDWTVRPVAELLYEHDYGGTETGSALIGAIWRIRDNISFDVGLRAGRVNDQPLREVRAGVTFAFGVSDRPSSGDAARRYSTP
jgi:hypothetical protein